MTCHSGGEYRHEHQPKPHLYCSHGTHAPTPPEDQIASVADHAETATPLRCTEGLALPYLPDPLQEAHSLLSKLGPHVNVESYLYIFNQTTLQENWAEKEWAWILVLLLTGETQ